MMENRAPSWSRATVAVLAAVLALPVFMSPASAVVPGNNGRIVFVVTFFFGKSDLYTILPDGSDLTRLTNTPEQEWGPSWSPDGTRIAFGLDSHHLWLMNADGSGLTQLTFGPYWDALPRWSPDGSTIVFQRVLSPNGFHDELYTVSADGSGIVTQLTSWERRAWLADWSPDGTKIVFARPTLSSPYVVHVWVMNADGTGQIPLDPRGSFEENYPSWSPDGARIAYECESKHGARQGICTMNADGSDAVRLTHNHNDCEPTWSPDGTKLVFSRWSNKTGQRLIAMNVDGTDPVTLVSSRLRSYDDPSWQAV